MIRIVGDNHIDNYMWYEQYVGYVLGYPGSTIDEIMMVESLMVKDGTIIMLAGSSDDLTFGDLINKYVEIQEKYNMYTFYFMLPFEYNHRYRIVYDRRYDDTIPKNKLKLLHNVISKIEKINLLVYRPHPAHFEDRELTRRGQLIFIMYMKNLVESIRNSLEYKKIGSYKDILG